MVGDDGGWPSVLLTLPSPAATPLPGPTRVVPLGGVPWGPGILDLRLLLAVTFLAAAASVFLLARRVVLSQALGAFECLLRELPGELVDGERPGPWRSGVARYDRDQLQWYATLAVGTRPSLVVERQLLDLVGRRDGHVEALRRGMAAPVVLTLRYGSQLLELAVAAKHAAALTLWAESGPPGRGLDVA